MLNFAFAMCSAPLFLETATFSEDVLQFWLWLCEASCEFLLAQAEECGFWLAGIRHMDA